MIGFAAFQIIARNAFGGGLSWADGLVQVALLWVTMVGASAASGADRHIKIDIVPRFAGPRMRILAARVTALGTAVLCAALGWTSIEFIRWDFIDGTTGFGAVPAWVCETIIPLAAGVMAARYLARTIWPAADPSAGERGEPAPRKQEPSAGEREGLAPRMEEPSAGEREGLAPRKQEPTPP